MTHLHRSILLVLLPASVCAAGAPTAIYSNGGLSPTEPGISTGLVTLSGAAAPTGSQWSETPRATDGSANAIAGFSCHTASASGSYRFADNFTVAGFAYGWSITAIRFYAYQTGHTSGSSPVGAVNLRIWNGPPNDPASTVVWGDTSTNRLVTSNATGIYRVFNTITLPQPGIADQARQVWEIAASTSGLVLPPGSYWLDWQVVSTDPAKELFTPPVTRAGSRGEAGWNALQFKRVGDGVQWTPIVDTGKPVLSADLSQDLPFIIEGEFAPPPCPGDANGSSSVDFPDITVVLQNWSASYLPLSGPGDSNGDGQVNFSDITTILVGWGRTCP